MNLQAPHLVFLAGSLVYLGLRAHHQRQVAREPKAASHATPGDRALVLGVAFAQGGLPLLLMFTPLLDLSRAPRPAALSWIGALVMLLGLWLFWRSHADLGRNWSVTLELATDHQLITQGVYRRIRHPMYAAFMVMGVAQALLLENLIAGPAALVAVSLLVILRVPNEERMMRDAFGAAYDAYVRRTGALLPRWTPGAGD